MTEDEQRRVRHPWLNSCLYEFRLAVHAFAQPCRSRVFRQRRFSLTRASYRLLRPMGVSRSLRRRPLETAT